MIGKKTKGTYTQALIFTVLSQGIVLFLGVLSGFVLPQRMGPESYGYWQVYLFYLTYMNLFGLGFNDGIALNYGGTEYEKMPFYRLRSAVRILNVYLLAIVAVGCLWALKGVSAVQYKVIYTALVVNIPFSVIQCIVMTVYLAVGRTTVYNLINVILKLLTVAAYFGLIFLSVNQFYWMILADSIIRLLITLWCVWLGRDVFFGKAGPLKEGWKELCIMVKGGSQITVALIASMLIPMMGRTVIERYEPIEIYGVFAFAMSLLSIVLSFANVAGTVAFPFLKKMDADRIGEGYTAFAEIYDVFVGLALLMFVPLKFLLQNYMVKYAGALLYLPPLLAMCVPLGKQQLLLTPYYKAYRMERAFLVANVCGLAMMAGALYTSYGIFHTTESVAWVTMLVIALWTIAIEYYLRKKTFLPMDWKCTLRETCLMLAFLVGAGTGRYAAFVLVYVPVLLLFLVPEGKKIVSMIRKKNNGS